MAFGWWLLQPLLGFHAQPHGEMIQSIYKYSWTSKRAEKKKVVLVNDPVFSQLTYFGSDRAIQPKRPKMAEIWLKSNFLCVSMVSHPITSLSFTKVTLVALIHPWRVWLDPWGLRFRAWAPAMLCLLFFAGVVHCSGIGCQLAKISMLYDTCCSDSGSQSCTIWDSCLRVGLHAYKYLIGVIHNT